MGMGEGHAWCGGEGWSVGPGFQDTLSNNVSFGGCGLGGLYVRIRVSAIRRES